MKGGRYRKAAIAAIALVMTLIAFTAAACSFDVDIAEGREMLTSAIENSRKATEWYVKYKTQIDASTSEQTRLYVVNEGTEEFAAHYDFTVDRTVSTSTTNIYYGKSRRGGVSDKEATDGDYKTVMAVQGEDEYTFSEITSDEFFADDRIAPYTLDAICDYLDGLTEDELQISSITTNGGWVTYYYVSDVVKEGNPLNGCTGIELRVTNEKLSTIYFTDTQGRAVQIDIAYGGPNFTVPEWTGEN